MQDDERFECLRGEQRQAEALRQQIAALGDEFARIERNAAQVLAGYVLPHYQAWQPQPGDKAWYVHVIDGIYFQVVVREVLGRYVRTQAAASHHTAYYSVVLDDPAEEYTRPVCIAPPALFDILIKELPLRLAPFV